MKTKFEKQVSFSHEHVFLQKYRNLQNLPHWHREHELIAVESGSATLMADGNFFTLQQGGCAFLHSEEIHSIRADAKAIITVVKIDASHYQRLIEKKHLLSPLLSHSEEICTTLSRLGKELSQRDEYSSAMADSIATQLLVHMLRTEPLTEKETLGSDTEKNYKALLDLITHNYAYMTFDDAATFMHFSRPYFSKYFYNHAGMSFTRYLNTVRISFAVEKLLEQKMTVTEVSQSCGFNTIRNFNRVFKELTGYTPNGLPQSYKFIQNLKEYADTGFDPTLNGTEVLEP